MAKTSNMDALRNMDGVYSPDSEAKHRLVVVYTGDPGEGKTHQYLTMPEPIVIFDIDHSLEGVIEKFADKDITIVPVNWPPDAEQAEYRLIWNDMREKFDLAVEALRGTGGSIVFDTFTELVELAEWAFLGKITEIPPQRHKIYQAPLRGIVRTILDDTILNAAFLHKWGPQYGNPQLGELKGYKDIAYQVQAVVLLTRNERGDRIQEILKCRQNGEMQGMEFPSMTFESLSKKVWS